MKQRLLKPSAVIALLLAAYPLIAISTLYCYAVRVSLEVGHWPSYNNPDPKNLGWEFGHLSVQLFLFALPVAVLACICFTVVGRSRAKDFPFWTIASVAAASWAIWIVYSHYDPGGLLSWFWD